MWANPTSPGTMIRPPPTPNRPPSAPAARPTSAAVLSPENLDWLKSLPYKHELDDVGLHLCHGSPLRLEEFEYIFAPEQARECLQIYDELGDLTLIGHSHLCKVFKLLPGEVEELPAQNFQTARFRFSAWSTTSRAPPRRSSSPSWNETSATAFSSASEPVQSSAWST